MYLPKRLLLSSCVLVLVAISRAFAADTSGSADPTKSDPLPDGARARLGSGRMVHSNQVFAFMFMPDGKQLISTGGDGHIRFWDTETGRELRSINPYTDSNNPNAFNPYYMGIGLTPDGKMLGITLLGKGVMLYDTSNGKLLRTVGDANNQGYGYSFCFSHDSKLLATMTRNVQDKAVHLFDAESGKELRKCEGHENFPYCGVFSSDGKHLFTGSEDQTIRMWDVETGKEERTFEGHRAGVLAVATSADGKYLASVGNDASVRLWNTTTGAELQRFGGMRIYYTGYSSTSMLRLSPDGKVLTGCMGNGIYQWDTATGKALRKPQDTNVNQSWAFAMSADEKYIARWGNTQMGRIALLDGTTEKEMFPGEMVSAVALAVSPDSKFLATGGTDKVIRIWDMSTAKEVQKIEGHTGGIAFLYFMPDGKSLISASRDWNDRTVSVWDVETAKELRVMRTGANNIQAMGLARDGRTLACLVQDQQGIGIRLFDPEKRKEIRKVQNIGYSYSLALSPDGKSYVTQAQDGSFVISDVAEGKEARALLRGVYGFPFYGPDSKTLAVSGQDGIVRLIDTASGKELRQIGEKIEPNIIGKGGRVPFGYNNGILAFSADGRMIATVGKEGALIWEIATGKQRRIFSGGHQAMFTCLAFTPDGSTLISASQEGQVIFWDLVTASKDEKQTAEQLTAKQADELWNDLLGDDGAKAYRAIRLLRAAGKVSLPLLKDRLRPAEGVEQKKLDKLIADLDSAEFEERTAATQELEKLGELAEPTLRKTLESKPSLEVVKRIDDLLQKLDTRTWTGEKLRAARALEALEHMKSDEAKDVIEKLAAGAEGAGLTREAQAVLERCRAAGKR